MDVSDVVEAFGGPRKMSEIFGVGASAVSNWIKRGRLPAALHVSLVREAKRRRVKVTPAAIERLTQQRAA